MSFKDIVAKTRKRTIIEKRHMLHFLSYIYTKLSLTEIGFETNRDHATVLHSRKAIIALIETDKEIRKDYHNLCRIIERQLVN